jgi:hypothetical protein
MFVLSHRGKDTLRLQNASKETKELSIGLSPLENGAIIISRFYIIRDSRRLTMDVQYSIS